MIPENYTVIDYNDQVLHKESIEIRIEELRQLILYNDMLYGTPTNDEYLLRFLHCHNFEVSAAFQRVLDFHAFSKANQEWFSILSPLERKTDLTSIPRRAMLPGRDREGRSIYVIKIGKIDPTSSTPQAEIQLDDLWFESVLDNLRTQETGISIIMDVYQYSWRLFRWLTPSNLRFAARALQILPCKEFIFHIVNTSFLVNASIKIVWLFISDDLKKRIKFHFDSWPSLHEYIDPEVLPSEYGGYGPDINYEKIHDWFFSKDEEIRKNVEYRKVYFK